jgi:hypothetical protein
MALFKDKWEIKTWADLSASVADSSNALTFRPKHRLPHKLQQGAKASKKATGYFNRDSILTSSAYPDGFYIYDTGSGLSYTAIPKDNFKTDMTAFLQSSSLSTSAKSQISTSFNATNWSPLIVQIDESDTTPATASFTLDVGIIGDASESISIVNTSTNTTNIHLLFAGTLETGRTYEIEYTLPMETISFTPNFASQSLQLTKLTGSAYTSAEYNNSVIFTPHSGSPQTASVVGKFVGSGSFQTYGAGYTGIEYDVQMKALGDGNDSIYSYTTKKQFIQFPSGSTVVSQSYLIYGILDTGRTGAFTTGVRYHISGSSANALGNNGVDYSHSHIFKGLDGNNLQHSGESGIYVVSGSTTGYLASLPTPGEVTTFSGTTYL